MSATTRISATLISLAFAVSLASPAIAQGTADQPNPSWGTTASPTAPKVHLAPAAPAAYGATYSFSNVAAAVSGCGLRNRRSCDIDVGGVTGSYAFSDYSGLIYWAVITNGAPESDAGQVTLVNHLVTTFQPFDLPPIDTNLITIAGTVIGTSSTPCWSGDRITVYRGLIPTSFVQLSKHYHLLFGGTGTGSEADPWVSSPLPQWEGAAIVLLTKASSGTTAVFENPVTTVAGGSFSYTLTLPVAASTSGKTKLWRIAADGQLGSSITLQSSLDNKTTTLNGVLLGGTSSSFSNIGMFLGHIAWPLPQLFDVVGVDAGSLGAFASTTGSLAITDNYGNDCVTHVASVLEIH
jgi:hypothetical protein